MAWKAPNPPAPEIGIELNIGTDLAGFGEQQPQTPSPTPQPVENQVAEQQQTQSQPEPVQQPVVTPDVAKPVPSQEPVTKAVTQPEPSPVTQQEEVKPKPKPQQQEQVVEKPKETVKPALFPGEKSKESSATQQTSTSQGDQPNKTGDQGDEKGKADARALYGEQGGGNNGPQLSIVGWTWDAVPRDRDASSENGRVVIDFIIDDRGYVTNATIAQSTVSLGVAQFYKRQVENLTFSKTSAGIAPSQSKGSVTFIIQSR
ncbi:hypothetical protein [Cesiribacter andamanensis]|uniref:TonB C-terminal domain-containing protein n=1 Tax=Cesiribacter andamanensis AMV16 TaxID=1279009 RepID=M7N6N3_9BACT|nr:hypothetical protein [Cesiribacter andamanensis]EMR02886.1 hypothetical protein ADICEAN_01980 [Cesiribacter andamanensis AMV16]